MKLYSIYWRRIICHDTVDTDTIGASLIYQTNHTITSANPRLLRQGENCD